MFGEWKTEVAPTVEDYGVMAHKDCTVCARHFDNDGNEIKDLRIAKIGTHKVIVQRLEGRKRKNRQHRKELYLYRNGRNNPYGCV